MTAPGVAVPSRFRRYGVPLGLTVGAGWIVWWSVVNGRALQRDQWGVKLGAAPLVGRNEYDGWDWRFSWCLVIAGLIVGVAVIAAWRGWWRRMSLRMVIATSAAGSAAFAVALALADGSDGLTYGAKHGTEYWANLPALPPAGDFVRDFTERISRYSVHIRGHPPGFVLLLKTLAWLGADGVWPVVGLSIVACAVVVAAVLWTVRSAVDDACCRSVAPFLVVAPYAVWMVTSADAVFAAVGAAGVGCVAHALWRGTGWRRIAMASVGGLLLGSLLFLTYLGATLLTVPAAVILAALCARRWRRTTTVIAAVTVGSAVVIGGFFVAGFWWLDGVAATKREYFKGSAKFRPFGYFWIGNLGAAMFALGPMTAAALGRLRQRPAWWLVGGALVGIAVSDLSHLTKAEVERIWLLFYPWVTVATAALWSTRRRWLAPAAITVQGASAILLQAALVTKW